MPLLARRNKQQATSKSKGNLKFRTILLETLEQRSLFAADILNTSLHLDTSGPITEPAQTEEPKQSLRRVKEAFTAGNAVRFPDSNYFSTLIAGVQEGAKVSGDEAVDAAWSDFHQRTANVPDASKASFGIIQSVADNPRQYQSKLLHNDLGARSIDRSPLDSSTTFGPVVPTTQLVMQLWSKPASNKGTRVGLWRSRTML